MKPSLVIIGSSGPLLRFLNRAGKIQGVSWSAAYLDETPGSALEDQIRSLGLPSTSSAALEEPAGITTLRNRSPDWILSLATRLIFPTELLTCASQGALNAHPGPLPQYAGLYPAVWAMREGQSEAAATVHWIEQKIDAGPIAHRLGVPLESQDTGLTATLRCANAAADALAEVVGWISERRPIPRRPQNLNQRHYFGTREAALGDLDWRWSARRIVDFVRSADFDPFPSPIATPRTSHKIHGTVWIRKTCLGGPTNSPPGSIIRCDALELEVAAGDAQSVCITHWSRADSPTRTHSAIDGAFEVSTAAMQFPR